MPEVDTARILIVATDAASRQAEQSFKSAGFDTEVCAPAQVGVRAKEFEASLVWIHADVDGPVFAQLLGLLEKHKQTQVPLVLVAKDSSETTYVRQLRTSLVEILKGPFTPSLHTARLRALLTELETRSGTVRGRGAAKEFGALFAHLARTHRSGDLKVSEGTEEEGHFYFLRGQVKSAGLGALSGAEAQQKLLGLTTPVPWSFSEGAGGADGIVDLAEASADESSGVFEKPAEAPGRDPFSPYNSAQRPGADDSPFGAPLGATVGELELPPIPGSPLPPPPPRPLQPPQPPTYVPPPPPPPVKVLPVPVAPAPAPSAPPHPAEAQLAALTPVLLVDDDATLTMMFSAYFAKKGYPVVSARDGVEAMTLLTSTRFEVVIADLNMPRLDGWGLLKALREDYRTHEALVALFSCQDDYRESLRALHAGAQAYYSKGLKLNVLEQQVRELAEPRRRFRRLLETQQSVQLALSSLGPQWVLHAMGATSYSAQLDAFDGWSTYRLNFHLGQLQQITAQTAGQTTSGERALMAFLASRTLEGSFAFSAPAVPSEFGGLKTEALLTKVVAAMNAEQQRSRDELLRSAKQLIVNPALYRLYAQVGPSAWQPIVKALCEEQALPRDVMTRLQVTPQEMGQVLKDLLRRGVVTLQP